MENMSPSEILVGLIRSTQLYDVTLTMRNISQNVHRTNQLKEHYRILKERYSKLEEENRKLVGDTTGLVEIKRRLVKNNRKIMANTKVVMEKNVRMRRTLRRLKNVSCATLSSERHTREVGKVIRIHRMMEQLGGPPCRSHCQR
ncbi:hypothetical protein FPSE_11963 [Fusarium pseudograminearum CS3096]|uniref:Uncharacterized protein n=1 Tax=Fusarium pseudograminearum (strain CS3096) TaxID=1028729 RepID=K3VWU1_FUSPC|nr:hypothetical protein FPSE_11963 [Fusarium pseudograminearum CS3096]EKJ67815.1 hypothetical protein FPSE_11963 [Fusarium pseudograminearum CS3096]